MRVQVTSWKYKCDQCGQEIEDQYNAIGVFMDTLDCRVCFTLPDCHYIWIDEHLYWCTMECLIDWLQVRAQKLTQPEEQPHTVPCCQCGEPVVIGGPGGNTLAWCRDCAKAEMDSWA